MIEHSFRCLRLGWFSAIPVVGVIFALRCLSAFRRAFACTGDEWNPARAHLFGGATLALVSLLVHALLAGTLIWLATR